jgi:hypothetical protein
VQSETNRNDLLFQRFRRLRYRIFSRGHDEPQIRTVKLTARTFILRPAGLCINRKNSPNPAGKVLSPY